MFDLMYELPEGNEGRHYVITGNMVRGDLATDNDSKTDSAAA